MHAYKLVFRAALLIWALIVYITNERYHHMSFSAMAPEYIPVLCVVWLSFAVEMLLRFFPSKLESMGCQKQFERNFIDTGAPRPETGLNTAKSTAAVALSWIALNGIIALLYFLGIYGDGIMVLVSLFYSVSDMICILFFCPFQSWMMKNRCCTTCRIYNWDFLMMFTPLIFIPSVYTWSLAAMSLALFIRWEITVHRHRERFAESCNAALRCENCQEKLCHHKKQLHKLWQNNKKVIKKLYNRIDYLEKELKKQL